MMPPPMPGGYGPPPGYPPPGLGAPVGFLPIPSLFQTIGRLFNRPKPRPVLPPSLPGLPSLPELFNRNRQQFCQIFCPPNQTPAAAGGGRRRRRRRRRSGLSGWGW